MVFRRKFKRVLIVVFFTTLVLKIHNDYQMLSKVNEFDLRSSSHLVTNDSSHVKIVNLNNIKDIIYSEDVNDVPKSKSELDGKYFLSISKDIDLTRTSGKPETKSETRNYDHEDEKKSQIDSPQLELLVSNDSRIPSFRQNMELYKRLHNGPNNETKSSEIDQQHSLNPPKNQNGNQSNPNPNESMASALKRKSELRKKFKSKVDSLKPKTPKKKTYKVSHVVDSSEISLNETEILRIKREISRINEEQYIHNKETFGPLKPNDTVVVVQVHNRLANLKYLVESLTHTKYIDTALVIFSHDFWDENINRFVKSITNFRVLQIFFPYSIQLNPSSFPGRDPRDCVWNQKDLNRNKSTSLPPKCLNSKWADSYGHYREASFTQIKHHWWWKLVQVFERIRELRNFTGQVIFLEEDHYVMPDLLHVLHLLLKEREKHFSDHRIMALGNYQRQTSSLINVVEKGDWVVNKQNLGFAFDKQIYDVIKKCYKAFCFYDDYNWDWTMAFLSKTCAQKQFLALATKFSRVLHIGSCGTHVRKENCNLDQVVNAAKIKLKGFQTKLFPSAVQMKKSVRAATKPKKSNGGWGDFRDKLLCLSIMNGTSVDQTIEKLQFPAVTKAQVVS